MTGFTTVFRKEFRCFLGGGPSTLLLHAMITVIWSLAIALEAFMYPFSGNLRSSLAFFAVIITANFANTVFISERVNGSLEVFITSGLSRDAILFGKMAFVVAMTALTGLFCAILMVFWADSYSKSAAAQWLAYLSVAFMNAAAGAFLSVRMGNPRFLHFINLFMTGGISVIIVIFQNTGWAQGPRPLAAVCGFTLAGAVFTLLARREFAGERIIRPIIF